MKPNQKCYVYYEKTLYHAKFIDVFGTKLRFFLGTHDYYRSPSYFRHDFDISDTNVKKKLKIIEKSVDVDYILRLGIDPSKIDADYTIDVDKIK
jgi:hypothetical protein